MNEIRQKFEEWAKGQGDTCSRIECCRDHNFKHARYDSAFTEWEWKAWRAAYEAGEIAMREKAADVCASLEVAGTRCFADKIRALALSGAEEATPAELP